MRDKRNTKESEQKWLKRMYFILTTLLFLKIAGFFTISENINITRAIKVFLRLLTTGGIILVYAQAIRRGYVASFIHRHTLVPFLYFAYLFLGFASLLWSTNTVFTTLQLFMTSESIIFVYFFMATLTLINHYHPESPLRLSRIFARSIFVMILIFVAGMYINPDQFFRMTHGGEVARLGGFMMNPNELGMLAVVGMACALVDINDREQIRFNVLISALMLYGLLLTQSRSSLGSFLLVVIYFISKSKSYALKVAILAGIVLSLPIVIKTIVVKQGDLQEVLSMTGRIPFWKALLTEGLPKEPWLGFGFMRIAYGDYFSSVHTYAAKMTHNTFIQVLMNLGFIGFGIAMSQMAVLFRAFFHSDHRYNKIFFIAVFIPIFINSLTEFGIWGENNFGILFYQYLIFLFVIRYYERHTLRQRAKQKLWDQ